VLPVIRRVPLGAIIQVGLAVTVFLFACGSSSVVAATQIGASGRWLALFVMAVLAFAAAYGVARVHGIPWRALRFAWFPAAFLGIALLSVTWSPRVHTTIERAVSFAVLLATATALGIAGRVDLDLRRRAFAGLALGASVVGLIGVLMAIAGMSEAEQPSGGQSPWRFKGFGQNPNTVAVLAAVAAPIIAWLGFTATSRRARWFWIVSFMVLVGTTIATLSRGGLIAEFVGVAVVLAAIVERWPRKAGAIAAFGTVLALGVVVRQATTPAPPPFVSAVQPGITTPSGKGNGGNGGAGRRRKPPGKVVASALPQRTDEIGNPGLSTRNVTDIGSGRVAAWLGALKLIRDRPLLGYGFGTEEIVFVDRWYYFNGARTENSVLGILLQVGVLGLLAILGFVVVLAREGVRAVRSVDAGVRSAALAPLGVLAAALVLVFFQSYVYSVGNVATVTVWIALFLLGMGIEGGGRNAASA
jgi:hypothetical protein